MAVKELIGLFESASNNPHVEGPPRAITSGRRNSWINLSEIEDPPPPRLARFLNHPRQQNDIPVQEEQKRSCLDSDTTITNYDTPLHDNINTDAYEESSEVTLDVTEEARNFMDKIAASNSTVNDITDQSPTNPEVHKGIDDERQPLKSHHHYPPNTPTTLPFPLVSTPHRRPRRRPPHTPVPAVTLFARTAAPLYLPKLDDYLASLKPPKFTLHEGRSIVKGKSNDPVMFPPMDRLAACGQSIEELEENSSNSGWRNRGTIFGAIVNVILGFTGSSALATYYSLQGLFNTVQVFALLLSTIVPIHQRNLNSKWRNLLLGKIPNILALNFASTLTQSLLYLILFMGIAAFLLSRFYRSTCHCRRYHATEGLQEPEPKGAKWGLLIVTFLLTIIYLPLSTLAVHVLVWSQDLWIVPNLYINATSNPPIVPSLGPPDAFRDPLDFCWTTTMAKDQVNFAPILIIISAVVLLALTMWFPIRLRHVIQHSAPKVDPYTELGQLRSKSDMDREYQRLLLRDRNPFSFLYKGFRRNNGAYQSTYLFAKLSTLLIVAVIDANNCLFRSFSRTRIAIARQVLLLISTLLFFSLQCYLAPFIDPVDNASEWVSRLNYIATAGVALAIALNAPHQDVINGPILYTIYAITYGLTFYFLIIDTSIMHRVVKRIARRIDFSLDVFSPRLDVSLSSLHIRRRIWQESTTTLLLTSPECRIPSQQRMVYAQARDSEYPPYLLNFEGMPGERHVENLKILRDTGTPAYKRAVALVYGPDRHRFRHLESEIQKHFLGPDCYWKNPKHPTIPACTNFFGNAWWIPFPPTLVMKYDDGAMSVLSDVLEFEEYISQNSSQDTRRRREIRLAIRALDGQTVIWPYEHIRPIGAYSLWCCGNGRYEAETAVHYQTCVLRIKRHGYLVWGGMQLGSGFNIELVYGKDVRVDGTIIGLNDDFDLTQPLARFLFLNEELITERLENVLAVLTDYRAHHWKHARLKNRVLTYRFLSIVYDHPQNSTTVAEIALESERDLRVRQLIAGNDAIFQTAYERLTHVSTSPAMRWWYIFWDDLWRRNNSTISALQRHAIDFDPHYPTSIAYTPLPRPVLEAFLIQRGLLSKIPKRGDFFHGGFLNKLYLRLNEAAFSGSSQGILFHVGDGTSERDMLHIDLETQARSSTMGTGGGTDYDQSSIRARPTYKWEALLDDPVRKGKNRRRRWFAKMGAWFGITPLWNSGMLTQGLAADVRLENGRYVLIDDMDVPHAVDPFRDK